jgi:hypothetical protein
MATFARDDRTGSATSITTRTIVVSGLLAAIQILLGLTGLGFIPLPTGVNATILHIPAIVAGVLQGPVAGVAVGLIFGLFSFLRATNPAFADPLVAILPRLFPGLVAWLVFRALYRTSLPVAAAAAGVLGTLTNTVLVLTMGDGGHPRVLHARVRRHGGPHQRARRGHRGRHHHGRRRGGGGGRRPGPQVVGVRDQSRGRSGGRGILVVSFRAESDLSHTKAE